MWYKWSVFDELVLDFEELGEVIIPEDYKNSIQFRIGVHYDFAENWQLRGGYIYDETPQPIESVSPLLPDNDRHDFSIGLGYTLNKWQFDAGYMLVDFGERSTVENGEGKNHDGFDGTYATIANLFFISFGYNFD
jgi:long-chain fatty acid transport protein